MLSYPTYVLGLVHGLLAGTDTQVHWVALLYGITGGMIVLLLFLHAMHKRYGGPVGNDSDHLYGVFAHHGVA